MIRAAIYARFSTDLQNDRSIEDQVENCRALARREGLTVVSVFEDRAQSGSTMHGRPGLRAMLSAASERGFDVLICESMSRVGRDQEDRAAIRKRLEFSDVRIMSVADGVVTNLTDGIRAVIDGQYLADLKVAIRRGMGGVIREGRHCGGAPYGYRAVKGEPGQLEIMPVEAAIVRRAYEMYLSGKSPRDIAGDFNREGIPPPRGSYWRQSTLNGDNQRAFGILRNEIYVGRLIWNKTRKVRHPDTGRRLSRMNPPEQWQRTDAPHLRIIDDETFAAAQDRRKTWAVTATPRRHKRGRMLSGLLRCGCCGAGMSLKDIRNDRPRIVCTQMREARTCDNRKAFYLDDIERSVVSGLRSRMGSRAAVALYVKSYNDECQKIASTEPDSRAALMGRLADAESEIGRIVSAIAKGIITEDEAKDRLSRARAERERLTRELTALSGEARVIRLDRTAVDSYLDGLSRADELINLGLAEGNAEVAEAVRGLIETVTVVPPEDGDRPQVKVLGHLHSLLGGSVGAG